MTLITKFLKINIACSYRLLNNLRIHHPDESIFRKELRIFLESHTHMLRGKRILDVGSGPWNGPKEIFASSCSVTTFDTVPYDYTDIVGDIYELENIFQNTNRFDAVIATEIFEHLAEPTKALEQIYTVLSSDGLLIASTPFNKNLHGEDYGDYWRITRQGWKYLLDHTGYKLISLSWLGEEMLPLAYFVTARKTS